MNKQALIEKAKRILGESYLLDTETNWNDERTDSVIEFALLDCATAIFVGNDFVKTDLPIPQRATDLHGICRSDLFNPESQAMSVAQFKNFILDASRTKALSAFKLSFDVWAVENTINPIAGGRPQSSWNPYESELFDQDFDIMELANRYFVEHAIWNPVEGKFKRLGLKDCLKLAGIEFEGIPHRARNDVLNTYKLLQHIAAGK